MKKRIFAALAAVLILIMAVLPVFADPAINGGSIATFSPFYEEGDPYNNGDWSIWIPRISGDFIINPSLEWVESEEWPVESYFKILEDQRDENGDGHVWYYSEFVFDYGFSYNGRYYTTIQVVLHAWDQEPRGSLRHINFVGPGYHEVIFKRSGDEIVTLVPALVSFGHSDNVLMIPDLPGGEHLDFFYCWFSGPVENDRIVGNVGLFLPVRYVEVSGGEGGVSGGEGGVSGGEGGGSGGGTPAAGFTQFMGLIINSFKDILSINFFGGLFSLGDLIGIIVAFGILFLAIKWFAGG